MTCHLRPKLLIPKTISGVHETILEDQKHFLAQEIVLQIFTVLGSLQNHLKSTQVIS
jgi:hypothetical protein